MLRHPVPVGHDRESFGCGAGRSLAALSHERAPRASCLDTGHLLLEHRSNGRLEHDTRARQPQAPQSAPHTTERARRRVVTLGEHRVERAPIVVLTEKVRRSSHAPLRARAPGLGAHEPPVDDEPQRGGTFGRALRAPDVAPGSRPLGGVQCGVSASAPDEAERGREIAWL